MRRGEIWWADMDEPSGSGPGGRRPVVIISSDRYNAGRIQTVIVAILTTSLQISGYPGNFVVRRKVSGLARDSVANVTQLFTLDRDWLSDHVGQLSSTDLRKLDYGLRLVLDL